MKCYTPQGSVCRILKFSLVFLLGFSFVTATKLHAEDPPADRTLTGSADFDLGRHIAGVVPLGTLTITSDDLGMDPARPITVSENGFAFFSNDILIRNGSGGSLVFDQDNQSHNFDIFYLGSGNYNVGVGLPSTNSYVNGSGDTVTAFGGNWFLEAEYTQLNGNRQNFSIDDERFESDFAGFNPVTLGSSTNPSEISNLYNRTDSLPLPLPSLPRIADIDGNFEWTISETSTPTIERRNTLFAVDPADEGDPDPALDLSGITVSAQGTALRDRRLFNLNDSRAQTTTITSDLGRFVLGTAPNSFQVSDTVSVLTSGSDEENTRLTLANFDETVDGVTATLGSAVDFNSTDTTANIDVSADFAIDANQTGTFAKTVDISSFITGEGLAGENVQETLDVGFQYSVVENNSAVANDITIFKFEGEDSTNSFAENVSARREFSTATHTAINVSRFANINNDVLQTITLSDGNGISGEGLAGENVTASVSYDIHQLTVQDSELSITESGQFDVGDEIVFENSRVFDATKLQAQAILRNVSEAGSSRWSLSGLDGWDEDLAAGESLTLNPLFDDTGIDTSGDTLGRNYRKLVTFEFQDGLRDLESQIIEGTDLGFVPDSLSGTRENFNIIGSSNRAQQATYFFENKNAVSAISGSAFVAAGTSLGSEGINLTNTNGNTSSQVGGPTELQIIDSEILNAGVQVDVEFVSLDNIDPSAAYAGSDTSGFFTDIAEVSGLGGIFHVMELSYDPALGDADIQWYSEELGLWVNAVLGNSNIDPGTELNPGSTVDGIIFIDGNPVDLFEYLTEMRFDGSYADYLVSLGDDAPLLGAFGSANGRAWAVIDHNSPFGVTSSAFSAIPEPNAFFMLLLATSAMATRRSRKVRL